MISYSHAKIKEEVKRTEKTIQMVPFLDGSVF